MEEEEEQEEDPPSESEIDPPQNYDGDVAENSDGGDDEGEEEQSTSRRREPRLFNVLSRGRPGQEALLERVLIWLQEAVKEGNRNLLSVLSKHPWIPSAKIGAKHFAPINCKDINHCCNIHVH